MNSYNKEDEQALRDVKTEIEETPVLEDENLTERNKQKSKKVNVKFLWIPIIISFIGTYNALLITSIIKWDSSPLFKLIDHISDNNEAAIWVLRSCVLINFLIFELIQVRLLILMLKELGASVMTVCVYICNFIWGNLLAYINTGNLPGKWSFVGMFIMIIGVAHLCQFGIVKFFRSLKAYCSRKTGDNNSDNAYETLRESPEKMTPQKSLRESDPRTIKVFDFTNKASLINEESSIIETNKNSNIDSYDSLSQDKQADFVN